MYPAARTCTVKRLTCFYFKCKYEHSRYKLLSSTIYQSSEIGASLIDCDHLKIERVTVGIHKPSRIRGRRKKRQSYEAPKDSRAIVCKWTQTKRVVQYNILKGILIQQLRQSQLTPIINCYQAETVKPA